ncbi:MAG TPA: lactate utilization protein [Pirellulales bacterium]|nr:lactate utilization protein [Pirellulales bacterium]
MSRESFLARVREAARAGAKYRVATADLPDGVGYCGAGDDPAARLVEEVNAVGGRGTLVADWAAARAKLSELLGRYAPTRALCWQHPVLDRLGLGELLAENGTERLDYDALQTRAADERRSRMLAADIGISSATVAVAETGTLALASGPGCERVASLLPPVHVAVIGPEQIVPDLFDLFAIIERSAPEMASNWVLVTGPSKTGDLELRLTTGVHGPGTWHVIVVRQ